MRKDQEVEVQRKQFCLHSKIERWLNFKTDQNNNETSQK